MDVQICTQCNWPMAHTHHQMCWTCWRESQGHKRIKSDDRYDELQKIIHQLLQETPDVSMYEGQIHNLQIQVHHLKMQLSQLKYENDQSKVDPKLIKELLSFCHPDKNQAREEKATELTKSLLSLRDK